MKDGPHSRHVRDELWKIIDAELDWRFQEHTDPADVRRTRVLVEDCVLLPTNEPDDPCRAEADTWIRLFNCNITKREMVHCCCRPGCCWDPSRRVRSRSKCVKDLVEAIMSLIRDHVGLPALIKWLTLWPFVCTFNLATELHFLHPRAELALAGEDNAAAS